MIMPWRGMEGVLGGLGGNGRAARGVNFVGRHYKGLGVGVGAAAGGSLYAKNQYQNRGKSSGANGLQGRSSGGMM